MSKFTYYISKPKREATCKQCSKKFLTAKDNQIFCTLKCAEKYRYSKRTMYTVTRGKALTRLYNKNKQRIGGYHYTPQEIQFILKKINKWNAIQIAKKLDRPVEGVRCKIRKLRKQYKISKIYNE